MLGPVARPANRAKGPGDQGRKVRGGGRDRDDSEGKSKFATLLALLGMFAVAACGGGTPGGAVSTTTTSRPAASVAPTATTTPTVTTTAPRPTRTPAPAPRWPTRDVSQPFRGTVPPAPRLTAIRVGAHPEGGYDRIATEFDALPGYRVGYRSAIVEDASGEPVHLRGRAFIQIVFHPAEAHEVPGLPDHAVTVPYHALNAYVVNGDYEGYVSIALGLTGEVGFRVGSHRMPNGHQVVYVDLAHP